MPVDVLRAAVLHDPARPHDHYPIRHHQRLFLIVRHIDERAAKAPVECAKFELHLLAKLEIERPERFVEQEDVRAVHDGACQRNALLLPHPTADRRAGPRARRGWTIEIAVSTRSVASSRGVRATLRPNRMLSATSRWGE